MSPGLDAGERRELRAKARTAVIDALRALGGEASRTAIEERALAGGRFGMRELLEPAPATAAANYLRLIDHELSWALTDLTRSGLVRNPRRGVWMLAETGGEPEGPVGTPVSAMRLTELRRLPYARYLLTPEWRRTRAAALLGAGNCCSLNVAHTQGLEVCHVTRERLGAERTGDLVALCRACRQQRLAATARSGRERFNRMPAARTAAGVELDLEALPGVAAPRQRVKSVSSLVSRQPSPAARAGAAARGSWLRRVLAG